MRQPSLALHNISISEGHQFFGRHGLGALSHPILELDEVECVAGQGLRGDRFFDYKDNYKGQITFFSSEVFDALCRQLGIRDKSPGVTRRNVITAGIDLNTLVGVEFEIQGVRFAGEAECSPCYRMDQAIAPGAEAFLKGRGGLRARILSDGVLSIDRS